MSRWVLLGWLCALYLAGLCFLVPLSSAVWLPEKEAVLVPPRGRGDGVVMRQLSHGFSRISLIDADLRTPGIRIAIHARNPSRSEWGWSVADALPLEEWCRTTGAVGGINGGFFGEEVKPGRKEVIGLLRVSGRTYARAPLYRSRSDRKITYAHSTLGFVDGRLPMVDWVVSDRRRRTRLLAYETPERLRGGRPWRPESALSGGPRLIHEGRPFVAARSERLSSAGALPRTFVAFARGRDREVSRLVLGTATALTYTEASEFLMRYFRERYGVPCDEAMCLDGGPSSQLVYRTGSGVATAQGGGVTVPTCVLIHDEARRMARRTGSRE